MRIQVSNRRTFAIIALFTFIALPSFAQRYPFHNLSVDDGLIQSQATCMAQDRTGNLWVGTLGGLSRYDGKNFTSYTIRNGLQSNAIWSLAVDSGNNIWIGTQTTISRYNGKTFFHYPRQVQTTHVLNNSQQIQIVNDTTWWRVAGDIYFITGGKIKYFVTPGPAGFVFSILAGHGDIWIAKEHVIYHQYNSKVDTLHFVLPPEQNPPDVNKIFRDRDGIIWVGTNSGLYKIKHEHIVNYPLSADTVVAKPSITSITQDKAGSIWLGTNAGVIKMTGNVVQYYNKHNGLSNNNFFDLLTDAEGNVWMASDGQGIFRFSGTQFTGLDETMGLPSAQVMAITSNKRDSLFLGTYDAGLYIFKDGKVNPFEFGAKPAPSVTSLCYMQNATLWIGTHGRGLWSYANGLFHQYLAPERGFPSNYIHSIYEDPWNRLWIGFANGVMLHEQDSFKTIGVNNVPVVSFLAIGHDSILIATGNGLMLYSSGNISDFKTNTVVDSYSIKCFLLKDRDVWMGSSDNGVIRYNLDSQKTFVINKSNGLRSDFVYNIVADYDGNIWVGTGFGIHKIRMAASNEPVVTFYGKAQGITGMESNINSVLKLPDSSIWFGTTNGALHYQPFSNTLKAGPPNIVLQSVKLSGENTIDNSYFDSTDNWYGIPYHLRLPFKKNNIAFTFQAITLSGLQQVLYRYRMEGLETPWSDWSATNSVTYSALPPGKYVFHVQCQGADQQSLSELTYDFEIITPFEKTGWFRLSVLLACILTGILLQYIVNSRKQRRQRLLAKLRSEEQAKIRLRTAEDFHDEIGNRLTRINVLTNVLKNKIPVHIAYLTAFEDTTGKHLQFTRDIYGRDVKLIAAMQ